jgi:predicted AlkP superfamily phosphohydrolase/phosphomutase
MTESTRRVLVIGWDGADWRILDPLMEAGALPNLAALIGRGARAVLTSTIPTHSWAAWPSFLTGVDPVDHGVFDILENRRGSSQKPVSFTSIRERTFLHDLTAAGVETLSINVPLTSPPPAITGRLIGGGVLRPDGRSHIRPRWPTTSRRPACRSPSTACRGRRSATSRCRSSTRLCR